MLWQKKIWLLAKLHTMLRSGRALFLEYVYFEGMMLRPCFKDLRTYNHQ